MERLYRETLASLSNALEAKDGYTGEHAQEVSRLAVEVGHRLGFADHALRAVELAALLHDIGKIRIEALVAVLERGEPQRRLRRPSAA